MHVLVTGGAGFIGATTAAHLLAAGHEVTVLDDLSTGHRDAVPDDAELVVADATDPVAVGAVLARRPVDACVHFAARIEAGASMDDPGTYFALNTGGTARLLQVLGAHHVERFVFSSTAAVYGQPERSPIDEDAPTVPTNPYGESKLLVERMLRWHHRRTGLRTGVLRYFNAAGATPGRPERHDPETHLVPIVLDVADGHRDHLAVYGDDYPTPDGTCVRDYVHVADLADAHVAALERLDEHGTLTCNLGHGTGYSVRDVVDVAREVTGHAIPTLDAPRRDGDPATLVATADRARQLLDWAPHRSDLATMIGDAWHARRDTTRVNS